jgi:hypothetical protein
VNPEKEVQEPMQITRKFRIACKSRDRVCKVIIDSGSTNNLVSTKKVEKLKLETKTHMNPYRVS